MIPIPKKMGNEESKRVASVVVAERNLAIADAKHQAAIARLEKFYEKSKDKDL